MADLPISGLPPVTLPLPADEFGVNNDGISKKMTRLQVHTLLLGEVLVLPNGDDASNPELQFPNSGLYEDLNDELAISQGNVNVGNFTSPAAGGLFINNQLTGGGLERVLTTGDGASFGEYQAAFDASSGSFPVTPNQGDWFNTTVAGTIDSQPFIVGDILIALVDTPSTSTFAANWTIVPHISDGDVIKVAVPANNQLAVWTGDGTLEGSTNFDVIGTALEGVLGNGPQLLNIDGVNIIPRKGDPNTGLRNVGDDRLAMVAGGIQGITLIEALSGVFQQVQTSVGITAFATGGQGSATQLDSSYNVVSTVATTGDSVKFSTSLLVGIVVYVKNDGANDLDLFPASGDDLGLGVNVAISVSAGTSVAFLGSVDNSTWTQLIFEEVAGGASFPLLAPDGNAGAPPYSFFDDDDTGWYKESAGTVSLSVNGSEAWRMGTSIQAIAGGPRIQAITPTSTQATLFPNRVDTTTGIGWNTDQEMSLIAGNVEACRVVQSGGIAQMAGLAGTTSFPGWSFISDLNTGLHLPTLDTFVLVAGGQEGIRIAESASIVTVTIGNDTTATHQINGSVELTSANPRLFLTETGVAADSGKWAVDADNLVFKIVTLTDAGVITDTPFSITRFADDVTEIRFDLSSDGTFVIEAPAGVGNPVVTMNWQGGSNDEFTLDGGIDVTKYLFQNMTIVEILGDSLRISDGGGTDDGTFNHDGTDFNLAGTLSADFNITGFTGGVVLASGIDLRVGGNVGFYDTAPVAQSAGYARNATIVEDRTLLASASATTLNNNNVLAALISDLQATGIIG